MSRSERDVVAHEVLLARRLGRLFRYEHADSATSRPDLMNQLRARRGDLIDALVRADAARRHLDMPVTPLLQDAMRALWHDIDAARRDADVRLDRLRTELLLARGAGIPSGIRGAAAGRLLGRG
jgi:hypothetical protein